MSCIQDGHLRVCYQRHSVSTGTNIFFRLAGHFGSANLLRLCALHCENRPPLDKPSFLVRETSESLRGQAGSNSVIGGRPWIRLLMECIMSYLPPPEIQFTSFCSIIMIYLRYSPLLVKLSISKCDCILSHKTCRHKLGKQYAAPADDEMRII